MSSAHNVKTERNTALLADFDAGVKYAALAMKYDIDPKSIRQIVYRLRLARGDLIPEPTDRVWCVNCQTWDCVPL